VADARPTWNRGQIQGHLGRFGFSGDEVRRKTDSLSGGERARVALALITLESANLLALDEPTNHLDVESIEALEDALERYEGTVLLVSHDRALLRELATRVWSLEDGRVRDYPGPFVDWEVAARERAEARASEVAASEREIREATRTQRRLQAEARRESEAVRRALRRGGASAEEAVRQAEDAIADLERALADDGLYNGTAESAQEAGRLSAELTAARLVLDEAMARWAEAAERVDALEKADEAERAALPDDLQKL
jgi:ATP-binding cassette subfamily F protein 3